MKLSLTLCSSLLVSGIASGSAQNVRGGRELVDAKGRGRGVTTAPHEVHMYEQVKFFDEPEWKCTQDDVGKSVGCLKCWNPRPRGGEALIVEVKSMYKRTDFRIRDEILDPPRKHCIWPKRGLFWTCFNTNQVIEPDTDWLEGELGDGTPFDYSDKPIYDENGDEGGSQCLPGSIVASLPDNGAIFF